MSKQMIFGAFRKRRGKRERKPQGCVLHSKIEAQRQMLARRQMGPLSCQIYPGLGQALAVAHGKEKPDE